MVGSTYQPTELHYGAKTIFKPLQTLQEYVLANLSYHLILLQYTDSLFVCLFVCSLYKFAPLQGMPQNALCPLMRSRAIFLWDRGVTDYLRCGRKSSTSIFLFWGQRHHFYSTCRLTSTKVFTDSGCLGTLQATEEDPERVLRKRFVTICPVAEDR